MLFRNILAFNSFEQYVFITIFLDHTNWIIGLQLLLHRRNTINRIRTKHLLFKVSPVTND